MRLALTGGGTGGHIYPALEVGREAAGQGAELSYYGSYRGQEAGICAERGIPFEAFPSEPLWSLKSFRGWRALIRLMKARSMATASFRRVRPDVVFSTGGYSGAPVMAAALKLAIPLCIHEANSIPGRTTRIFGRRAHAFTTTFLKTATLNLGFETERTGQPIRKALRDLADQPIDGPPMVLVVGGSQGSEFLNQTVPAAIQRLGAEVKVIHACGRANMDSTYRAAVGIEGYTVVPYLETDALVDAYRRATVVVARSGGTLAELALFRLPSVLVPLPTSADDHQMHNAREFEAMKAATVLPQPEASPDAMATALREWLDRPARRDIAKVALAEWDMPDATARIVQNLFESIAP